MFREKREKNSAEEEEKTKRLGERRLRLARSEGRGKKKRSNDWLDTSCRTEATVGLIKLRELAEVSSGLFRGAGEKERRREREGERGREKPGLCCTATQINFPGMALSLRSTHLRNNTR